LGARKISLKGFAEIATRVVNVMDDSRPQPTITVLFIDPNEEERQKWADQLTMRSAEYVVLQAVDGRSGLKRVKSESVDCVVLELDLPDRNGLSILFDLVGYAYNPQIAVIVLTNFPLDALCQLAIQNGAQSCMRKDQISVENLDKAIRKAIAAIGPHKNRAA
jgi:DNA-binding NarL/FixJ family response regulator